MYSFYQNDDKSSPLLDEMPNDTLFQISKDWIVLNKIVKFKPDLEKDPIKTIKWWTTL